MRFKIPFDKSQIRMMEGFISTRDGRVIHYHDGRIHRTDGPAVETPDGTLSWYGKRHREDGPAIEYPDGTKKWYVNGVRHRLDGPAIERANGSKEWWIQGTRVDISILDYDGSRPLTDEEITYLILAS